MLRRNGISRIMLVPMIMLFFGVDSLSIRNLPSSLSRVAFDHCSSLRAQVRNDSPGSELFPGKGSYVPSGLSEEEYTKIKKKEEEKLKSMNFGAWGPRFKRTDTPEGDWMVMPSLWTNGFNRGRPMPNGGDANRAFPGRFGPLGGLASFLKVYLPGFILSYVLINVLQTGFAMWKATGLTMRQALLTILKIDLNRRPSFYLSLVVLKAQALKVALASAATPLMTKYLEIVNRRNLWTKRRTGLVTVGASVLGLILWAGMLRLGSGLLS